MGKQSILFVNNNMKIGGVQKALLEVLRQLHGQYQITLLLFRKTGALLQEIPPDVRVAEVRSGYRYLGLAQGECRSLKDRLLRGGYALTAKTLGIGAAARLMDCTVRKELPERFDLAVSFLHCSALRSCYGGTAEYTLRHVRAQRKACWIHCDYVSSGTVSSHSRRIYRQYDRMVCVSEAVRRRFLEVLPELEKTTLTVPNPLDVQRVKGQAAREPFRYDPAFLNVLTVARLAQEKGIDRMIRAVACCGQPRLRYYIVGDGDMRRQLQELIGQLGVEDRVFLMGEQDNPYAFMAGADLLAVPSWHEAAPMVFQEAQVLGLPVLTTCTLSAREMIPSGCGLVVDNTRQALLQALQRLNRKDLQQMKDNLKQYRSSTEGFSEGFRQLLRPDDTRPEAEERRKQP